MAKRKHSQHPPSQGDIKKQKFEAKPSSIVPKENSNASSNSQHSANVLPRATLSKSALKRRRQIARRRKNKVPETGGRRGTTNASQSRIDVEGIDPSKTTETNAPAVPEQVLESPKQEAGQSSSQSAVHRCSDSPSDQSKSHVRTSRPVKQQRSDAQATSRITKPVYEGKGGLTKTKRRRLNKSQKVRQTNASSVTPGLVASKAEVSPIPDAENPKTGESQAVRDPTIRSALLRSVAQTNLLPRPKKQWIQEDVHEFEDPNANLHREVTKTTLLGRPMKEWIQQEVTEVAVKEPEIGEQDLYSPERTMKHSSGQVQLSNALELLKGSLLAQDQASTRKRTLQIGTQKPADDVTRVADTGSRSSSPPHQLSPNVLKNGESVNSNVPSAHIGHLNKAQSADGAITSPKDDPRRQHVYDLPPSNKALGLSQIRMNPSNFGSSVKSLNSSKATSVPSHSNVGDAKAAFRRFANFAHNRDESDSEEGSETSDNDDSDSSSEIEVTASGRQRVYESAASAGKASLGEHGQLNADLKIFPAAHRAKGVSDLADDAKDGSPEKLEALPNGDRAGPLAALGKVSGEESDNESAECSPSENIESDDEEVSIIHSTDHPGDSNNAAHGDKEHKQNGMAERPSSRPDQAGPRMQSRAELPLFGEFNAKHEDTSHDTSNKRSSSFLGLDLGSNRFAASQNDGQFGNAIADDDKDDVFRSIDDISREVFGSTLALPDSIMV